MSAQPDVCPLCGGRRTASAGPISGYVESSTYRVLRCEQCGSCGADPLRVDPKIYETIYTKPELIPGYARYAHYAETVLRQSDPLNYLTTREPCYWALVEGLRQLQPGFDLDILEVGCGLGYLTYALTRAGYRRSVGIDLSAIAVERARERYGCDYRVADIAVLAADERERFDAVILSEVIEHLEDPVWFIGQLQRLLKPGGRIILTTPSRLFGGNPEHVWATDPPPVHLWWLTEPGLAAIAAQAGLRIRFTDFSRFNQRHFRQFWKSWQRSHYPQKPRAVLRADYQSSRPPPRRRAARSGRIHSLVEFVRELSYRLRFRATARALDLSKSAWIGATLENR